MRKFLLFLLLFPSICLAQGTVSSTCIWSGSVADCLPSSGILLRNQRALRLGEAVANGSNYVALVAPSNIASDFTLTLPNTAGTNQYFLQTNGAGTLAWAQAALVPAAGAVYSTGSALASETALDPSRGGTGIANNSAATTTRSGNHALTLTTTGTTSLTLPTTGTLATLAGSEALTNKSLTGTTIDMTGVIAGAAVRGAASNLFGASNSATADDTIYSSTTPSTYGNALLVLLPTGTSGSSGDVEWAVCACRLSSNAYCSTVAAGTGGQCVTPVASPSITDCTDGKACIGYDNATGALLHYNRRGVIRATRMFMIGQ